MPKIGDMIAKLQVDGKTFQNPEWWKTQHKLKRNVKNITRLSLESKFNLRTSYEVTSPKNMSSADTYSKNLKAELDLPRYKEFAPWNSIFRKYKPVILFKKS